MYLIAPDLLADACGLSLGLMLALVPSGLLLWLLGWWSHRFWVVLLSTILAGVYGLHFAAHLHTPPLIAALLLAFSAGVLALALARLVAFAAGGIAGLLLVQALVPSFNQPLVTFLVCGLMCLGLFRPCLMALTGLAGALLLTVAALLLLHYAAVLDAPAWCAQSGSLLNWLIAALALLGAFLQFLLDRYVFRPEAKNPSWLSRLRSLMTTPAAAPAKPPTLKKAA